MHRMTRICTTVVAHDAIESGREQINNFSFALISPLESNNGGMRRVNVWQQRSQELRKWGIRRREDCTGTPMRDFLRNGLKRACLLSDVHCRGRVPSVGCLRGFPCPKTKSSESCAPIWAVSAFSQCPEVHEGNSFDAVAVVRTFVFRRQGLGMDRKQPLLKRPKVAKPPKRMF